MTTPTRIMTETIGKRTFTVDRALFVTSRGSCGVRLIHRIDGKRVRRDVWHTQRIIKQARVERVAA